MFGTNPISSTTLAAARFSPAERSPAAARVLERVRETENWDALNRIVGTLADAKRTRAGMFSPALVSGAIARGEHRTAVDHLLRSSTALDILARRPETLRELRDDMAEPLHAGLAMALLAEQPGSPAERMMQGFITATDRTTHFDAVQVASDILQNLDVVDLSKTWTGHPAEFQELCTSLEEVARDRKDPEYAALALRTLTLLGSQRAAQIAISGDYLSSPRERLRMAALEALATGQGYDHTIHQHLTRLARTTGREGEMLVAALSNRALYDHIEVRTSSHGSAGPSLHVTINAGGKTKKVELDFPLNTIDDVKSPHVRAALLRTIGLHFQGSDVEWTCLAHALCDPDGEVRKTALGVINKNPERAIAARAKLIEAVKQNDPYADGPASYFIRSGNLKDIIALLHSSSTRVQLSALQALKRFAPSTGNAALHAVWRSALAVAAGSRENAVASLAAGQLAALADVIGAARG